MDKTELDKILTAHVKCLSGANLSGANLEGAYLDDAECFLGATSRGKAQCAGGVGFMTDYFCCS